MIERFVVCPSCLSPSVESCLSHRNVPEFLFPVAVDISKEIGASDVNLKICNDCGHLFRDSFDSAVLNKIYSEYYAFYPYDANESMNAVYRVPFAEFFDMVARDTPHESGRRLLEIGCSKMENLLPFLEHSFLPTGIDPSPLAEGDITDTVKMISGYYEQTEFEVGYDLIVSRFNLEHISDLSAHIRKMRRDLNPGGRVVVQVPNIEFHIRNSQPFFVAHEHIHYFSMSSLIRLFVRHGFALTAAIGRDRPSLLACFRSPQAAVAASGPGERLSAYSAAVASQSEALRTHVSRAKSVVCYGCGLSLYWVLGAMDWADTKHVAVVDDNVALVGRAIPYYGLVVGHPERHVFEEAEIVVLTLSPVYHPEVLARLSSMGVRTKVLRISDSEISLEEIG